jgi:Tol biopolymer transport system component
MSLLNLRRILSLCLLLLVSAFAGSAQAQFQFAPATQLVIPGSSSVEFGDFGPSLSSDNLTLYFSSYRRPGGRGNDDMWRTTRTTLTGSFDPPVNLGVAVNTSRDELIPKTSLDGLSLYFVSDRLGTLGDRDVWIATRASTSDSFGPPVNLGAAINTPFLDGGPDVSADGLTLVFNSDRPGGFGQRDIYLATRATTADPFGSVVNLGPTINSVYEELSPSLTADALSLFFGSDGPGGFGDIDLWVSSRVSLAAPWGTPVNLGSNVNSAFKDSNPDIAWDGASIVFTSGRSGGVDHIYQAAVVPEPSTLLLAAFGLVIFAWLPAFKRRRRGSNCVG